MTFIIRMVNSVAFGPGSVSCLFFIFMNVYVRFSKFIFSFTFQLDRYFYLIDLMLSAHQPLLLVGPSGIGKSSLVQVCNVSSCVVFKITHSMVFAQ